MDVTANSERVLIVTRRILTHAHVGNTAVVLSLVRALKQQGFLVDHLVISSRAFGRRPIVWISRDADVFDRNIYVGGHCFGGVAFTLAPGPWFGLAVEASRRLRNWTLARVGRPRLQETVNFAWPVTFAVTSDEKVTMSRIIAGERYRAVIADYVYLAPLAAIASRAGIPSAVFLHDLMSKRHQKFRHFGQVSDIPPISLDEEVALLNGVDVAVAIQKDEAEILRAHPNAPKIVVAAMVIDIHPPDTQPKPGRIVFLGSDNITNRDALAWFLDDIWPIIVAARPDAQLDLVGSIVNSFPALPARVVAVGVVDDLDAALAPAVLAVSPMRVGSGLNIKMLDYFARGLPVVATSLSLEGLPGEARDCTLQADTADDFAREVIDLLADESRRKAAHVAALGMIERNYSAQAVYRDLFSALAIDNGVSGE